MDSHAASMMEALAIKPTGSPNVGPQGHRAEMSKHALQDYQMQRVLEERQKSIRLAMQHTPWCQLTGEPTPEQQLQQDGGSKSYSHQTGLEFGSNRQQYYQTQLMDEGWSSRMLPCQEEQRGGSSKMASQDGHGTLDVKDSCSISIELILQQNALTVPATQSHHKLVEKYPAKTHAHKVRQELNVTSGLVYLVGQKERTWDDTDGDMPFRQLRFSLYLSGANFPGIAVTYDIAQDYLILWVPVRAPYKVLWNGTVPSIEECMRSYDVDSVRNINDLKAYLEELLDPQSNPPTTYILHEDQRPPPLSWERPEEGPILVPNSALLYSAMSSARAVKTAYEVSQIRRAVDISSQAHREVLKHIKRMDNEAQVESMFLSKCRALGAKKQAYPPIAGSGPNAAVLHYGANDQNFESRQLMVLDAGCEFNCYASDVTRTFPLNGTFTKEAKEVYQIVLNMQDKCIDMIRPGQSWFEVSLKALEVARQGLLNIGVLQKGSSGEEPPSAVVRAAFFPHGLGHLVGLDTHDVIDKVRIKSPAVFGGKRQCWDSMTVEVDEQSAYDLREGMVITCEPGVYFNRAFIEDVLATKPDFHQYVSKAALEEYYPVGGCRLEDCILVTKDGYENLTTAPKGYEMINVINGEA